MKSAGEGVTGAQSDANVRAPAVGPVEDIPTKTARQWAGIHWSDLE